VTTTAGKWRLGIPGVPVVFFIGDAMAQRVTNRRPKADSAAFLSVEDIWQADEARFHNTAPGQKVDGLRIPALACVAGVFKRLHEE
jgi:hypothetical protein